MKYTVGQCVIGRTSYKDGVQPMYDRPYLIINIDNANQFADILTISSTTGKEHKLLMPTNVPLNKSIPPLKAKSFVKTDSKKRITFCELQNFRLMSKGQKIHNDDLTRVLARC